MEYGVRRRSIERERGGERRKDKRQSNLIWKGGISGVKSSKARVSENYEIAYGSPPAGVGYRWTIKS